MAPEACGFASAVVIDPVHGFGSGRLVFIRDNTLMAQPFDPTSGQTKGGAVQVAGGAFTNIAYAPVTVSANGLLLYESGGPARGNQMVWYDRGGKLLGAIGAAGNTKALTQWSRDGRFAVYSEYDPKTKRDIWVLPMEGEAGRKPVPFLRSEFNEFQGQLSPDSRWMAYTSDESGQPDLYVRQFPTGEAQWKISIAGGEQPRWRGDVQNKSFSSGCERMASPRRTRAS